MSKQQNFNQDLIRSLAALLDETHLSEIEYDQGGLRVRVARQTSANFSSIPVFASPPQSPSLTPSSVSGALNTEQTSQDFSKHPGLVKSPMVGVIYASPEPNAPRFFNVGDTVTEGQTLFLIEAMKTFNPIRAHCSGKVVRQIAEDGHPVEFGEPLVIIE